MALYKYHSLSNLQFVLDIIINARMFAASFEQLNDPMEGSYNHGPGKLTREQIKTIYGQKAKYRLLSLSEISNSTLMWSHYSEAHAGIVIGVSVTDPKEKETKVQYVDDLNLELATPVLNIEPDYQDIAKRILSKKLRPWAYERERRVFIEKGPSIKQPTFVSVKIMEVIFGINTEDNKKELIRKVTEKFCPGIPIRTLYRDELDIRVPA